MSQDLKNIPLKDMTDEQVQEWTNQVLDEFAAKNGIERNESYEKYVFAIAILKAERLLHNQLRLDR
jgi:hypothetical protein